MVVAIVFFVLFFGYFMFHTLSIGTLLFGNATANTTVQEVSSLIGTVDSQYADEGSFAGLSDSVAIQGGDVPANDVNGTQIVNPYGGDINLSQSAVVANGFDLQITGLDNTACAKVATKLEGEQISVNGSVVESGSTAVSPSAADSACTAGSTGNTVTVSEAR